MEPPTSDLQAQIDKLNLAIREWREQHDRGAGLEQQLSELGERGAEILNRWTETERRYTQAVGDIEARLRDWGAVEGRLQQGAEERLRAFERTVQHEWKILRAMHEEPLRQLREQAAALAETSVAAANLSLRGYERAEARLAALEADVRRQLGQLSGDVQRALAEMRAAQAAAPAIGPRTEPFQLDTVASLHEDLREADRQAADPAPRTGGDVAAPAADPAEAARAAIEATPVVARAPAGPVVPQDDWASPPALASSVSEAPDQADRPEPSRFPRLDRMALAAVVLVLVVAVWLFGLRQPGGAGAGPVEAAPAEIPPPTDAEPPEPPEVAVAPVDAELVERVRSARDVMQFALTGVGPARGAVARVLWSRSTGLVLNASRVPAPAVGSTYHVWLLGDPSPADVAAFSPDASGEVTVVADNPPDLPYPVHNVTVTIESADGTVAAPSGATALTRVVR